MGFGIINQLFNSFDLLDLCFMAGYESLDLRLQAFYCYFLITEMGFGIINQLFNSFDLLDLCFMAGYESLDLRL